MFHVLKMTLRDGQVIEHYGKIHDNIHKSIHITIYDETLEEFGQTYSLDEIYGENVFDKMFINPDRYIVDVEEYIEDSCELLNAVKFSFREVISIKSIRRDLKMLDFYKPLPSRLKKVVDIIDYQYHSFDKLHNYITTKVTFEYLLKLKGIGKKGLLDLIKEMDNFNESYKK